MNDINTYLDLIPAANQEQPDFIATVSGLCAPPVQTQDTLNSLIPRFDVDVAVGDQLDIIGLLVGFPREVPIAVTGVYFAWDDADSTGWEFGIWQDPTSPNAITVLPDDVYRNFIKAKIAANHWDGTTDGAYEVWDSAFKTTSILIQDGLDMSYQIAFVGAIIDSLTVAVILGGFLPLKPEGVRITEYLFTVNSGPIFAFDIENDFLDGWDIGSWPNVQVPT